MANAEAKRGAAQPVFLAELHARLGETDQAIEWLEKAYNDRDMSLVFLNADPKWESLRSDVRFQDLLRRMHLAAI